MELADSEISILKTEVHYEFTRSRGPGGQHVNKTETAVYLIWNLYSSQLFYGRHGALLNEKLQKRLNEEGDLRLREESSRDREANKKKVFLKFVDLLNSAVHVPKKRFQTKPTWGSKVRRKEAKAVRSTVKKLRGKVRGSEED